MIDPPSLSGNAKAPHRVVTFGEAMIRVTTPGHERFESSTSWNVSVGGSELNVAAALRVLDIDAAWVSALPQTPLGHFISRSAAAARVDIDDVIWTDADDGRTGLYFLEEGPLPRSSSVTYDRRDSAFARAGAESYDWPSILAGADALHLTGISLAVSPTAREASFAAVEAARRADVLVSFDVNFRSTMWSVEEAKVAFGQILPHVDILFASRDALRGFFDVDADDDAMVRVAASALGVRVVVSTRKAGDTSRSLQIASEAADAAGRHAETELIDIEVVDRIGGGDAFAAGFLAEYLLGSDLERGLRIGNAASAIKHTMPFDVLRSTREEIEDVASGIARAIVKR